MKIEEILKNKYIHIVTLAAIATLLYSISWHYEMHPWLDDGRYVVYNEHLGFSLQNIRRWLTQPCIGLFVPVTMFSFMFDYNIWLLDSLGYHLQNTFWFIITIIAVYACFIKLKLKPWHAFVLVLIYTVHPQRVESVVWITERKDVLSGALFFIALFFYLDRFNKNKFNFITLLIYILAILAKPMAITLPVVLVMIDFSKNRQFSPKYYIKRFWPYALVILTYLIIIANLRTDFIRPPTDLKRMFSVMLFAFYWYTKNSFFPTFHANMSILYPQIVFKWQIITQMLLFYALLIGGGIIAFIKLKKETILYYILPFVVCYIAVLSPVLGGFRFSSPDYADRYNYIPSVFMLFAAGSIAPLIISSRTRRVITFFLMVYIILLTYSTIMYLPQWKDSFSVYSRSCQHQPANINSVMVLGLIEAKAGNFNEAIVLSERLRLDYLNDSCKKPPLFAHVGQLYIKAIVLFKNNRKNEAFKILYHISQNKGFKKIVLKMYEGELFYSMLADCYLQKDMPEKAISCFEEIIKLEKVSNKSVFFYKGMIALFQNKKQEALSYFKEANQLDPSDKNIAYNLKKVRDSLK